MKAELYLFILLLTSVTFFIMVGGILTTNQPYMDLLLTVAVVHFVMSKLIWIEKREQGNES